MDVLEKVKYRSFTVVLWDVYELTVLITRMCLMQLRIKESAFHRHTLYIVQFTSYLFTYKIFYRIILILYDTRSKDAYMRNKIPFFFSNTFNVTKILYCKQIFFPTFLKSVFWCKWKPLIRITKRSKI